MRLPTLLVLFAAGIAHAGGPAIELERMGWITGTWQRIDLPSGDVGYEHWQATEPSGYAGIGVHERADGRRFEEKLSLVVRDGAVHYVADTPQNPQPVAFRLTGISDTSIAFENPEHDFPKKIEYRRDGERALTVRISAGDKSADFRFERKH